MKKFLIMVLAAPLMLAACSAFVPTEIFGGRKLTCGERVITAKEDLSAGRRILLRLNEARAIPLSDAKLARDLLDQADGAVDDAKPLCAVSCTGDEQLPEEISACQARELQFDDYLLQAALLFNRVDAVLQKYSTPKGD